MPRIVHTLDPYLIQIHGAFGIRWYALPYLLGFLLAYLWLTRASRSREVKLKEEQVGDLVFYLFLGAILGARFFHVFVFEYRHYGFDPLRWIAVWRGGLSFHGGLVGVVAAVALFARRTGVRIYDLTDRLVVPAAIALGFGRIGNFINAEMPGIPYEGAFCVDYSQNPHLARPPEGCRHPTQLYEMAKNWLIAGVLWTGSTRMRLRPGVLTWAFVMLYGIIRFLLMFLRAEERVWAGLTLSQIFSGLMALAGAAMLASILSRTPRRAT
jgi:phosphatidylglycerol---prolipoprotein diacylglyceryl transferase